MTDKEDEREDESEEIKLFTLNVNQEEHIKYAYSPPEDYKNDKFQKELNYHIKAGTHMWTSIAVFNLSEQTISTIDCNAVHLDIENLLTITVGCSVCEQPLSKKIIRNACAGEPKPSIIRFLT